MTTQAHRTWRFRLLCCGIGLISLLGGEWLARTTLLETRVSRLEALRDDGGRYVVNEAGVLKEAPASATAILYGDSSNDSVPASDRDQRFISQMLRDALAPHALTVGGISFPGNAVDWISSHLRYLVRARPTPTYVIVPINLRWISPGWRGLKNSATARRIYELQASGPFRWILGAKIAYPGPPAGYDPRRQPVETVIGPVDVRQARLSRADWRAEHGGSGKDYRRVVGTMRMALSYGLELRDEDPLFSEIDRIANTCTAADIVCLYYLPPFNLALTRDLNPTVATTLEGNLQRVRAFAEDRGYPLLDLSAMVAPEHFHDHYNEHVDEVGRRLIAECVASALRAFQAGAPPGAASMACRANAMGEFEILP